jgi:AcrR family transcriptional regulator
LGPLAPRRIEGAAERAERCREAAFVYFAAMASGQGRRIKGMEPEDRRRQRREELLESALELFASNGYANTSIEQICQNAMVGYKAFYDEFATKEQLFIALYDSIGGKLLPAVFDAFGQEGAPEDRLPAIVAAYIRAAMEDRRMAKVLFVTSAGVSEAVDLHRRAAHRAVADIFAQLYRSGLVDSTPEIGVFNGRSIALGVTGGMGEIVVDFLLDDTNPDVDELIANLVQFVRTVMLGMGVEAEALRRKA